MKAEAESDDKDEHDEKELEHGEADVPEHEDEDAEGGELLEVGKQVEHTTDSLCLEWVLRALMLLLRV